MTAWLEIQIGPNVPRVQSFPNPGLTEPGYKAFL